MRNGSNGTIICKNKSSGDELSVPNGMMDAGAERRMEQEVSCLAVSTLESACHALAVGK